MVQCCQPDIWERDHPRSHGRWMLQDPQETEDKTVSREPERYPLLNHSLLGSMFWSCPQAQHPRWPWEQEQVSRTQTQPKGGTARFLWGDLSQACPDLESEQYLRLHLCLILSLSFLFCAPLSISACLFSLPSSLCSRLHPDFPIHPPVVVDKAPHSDVTSFWLCQFHLQ